MLISALEETKPVKINRQLNTASHSKETLDLILFTL